MSITNNDWMATCDENAYAGGRSGIVYAEDVILQAELIALPFMYKDQKMPFCDFVYKRVKTFGEPLEHGHRFYSKQDFKDSELQFLTFSTYTGFYDRAVTGTVGAIPWPSFALISKKNTLQWNAFGCLVQEWNWEGSPESNDAFGVEKIKPLFYDVQRPTAPTYTRIEYATGEDNPYTFANCDFYISGVTDGNVTVTNTNSASITITNVYEDGRIAGKNGRYLPYLKDRKYEGKLEYYTLMTGIVLDYHDTVDTRKTIMLTYNLGYVNLGITGAFIKNMNFEEFPDATEENMLYKFSLEWEMGSGFVCRKV